MAGDGLIYPATNQVEAASLAELSTRLAENRRFLSGWELLGSDDAQAGAGKNVAGGHAHGGPRAGFALVRFSPAAPKFCSAWRSCS
jgi:hypothetical protein